MEPTKDFYCDYVFNEKIAVQQLRETEHILAFRHIKPSWTSHVVIVPKQHIARLVDLSDFSIMQEIFETATDIIRELGLAEKNYRIITNGGSYQDSQHLHVHLVSGEATR